MLRNEPSQRADEVARLAVDAALKVHRALGPGLLESVYEQCLAYELGTRGIRVSRQVEVPVVYEGIRIDTGFRVDLLLEDEAILELKAVEQMIPLHDAQVLTYLKLTGKQLGLLINFNVSLLNQGIKRLVLTSP